MGYRYEIGKMEENILVKYRNVLVKYRNILVKHRNGELGLPATHLSSCCLFIVPVILILFLLDFTISLSNF